MSQPRLRLIRGSALTARLERSFGAAYTGGVSPDVQRFVAGREELLAAELDLGTRRAGLLLQRFPGIFRPSSFVLTDLFPTDLDPTEFGQLVAAIIPQVPDSALECELPGELSATFGAQLRSLGFTYRKDVSFSLSLTGFRARRLCKQLTNPAPFTFGAARADELDELTELYRRFAEQTAFGGPIPELDPQRLQRRIERDPAAGLLIVARRGVRPVGVMNLSLTANRDGSISGALTDQLVCSSARRQGVGRALFGEVLRTALAAEASELCWIIQSENEASLNMWRSLGYPKPRHAFRRPVVSP